MPGWLTSAGLLFCPHHSLQPAEATALAVQELQPQLAVRPVCFSGVPCICKRGGETRKLRKDARAVAACPTFYAAADNCHDSWPFNGHLSVCQMCPGCTRTSEVRDT